MKATFELTGAVTEIASYPRWTQDMVGECDETKRTVIVHGLWDAMKQRTLAQRSVRDFMVGIWPVIERFPGYMSHSLLKTRFGRSAGDNMARRWLVRNIRVEQNHAEHWLNWAEGAHVSRDDVLNGIVAYGTQVLAHWCEEVSSRDTLAAGMAATNYAVEGATGEWSQLLFESDSYKESFPVQGRTGALRWLQLHAAYDDTHPWEALEIICTLVGDNPSVDEVAHLSECIKRSYVSMRILADHCLEPRAGMQFASEAAA